MVAASTGAAPQGYQTLDDLEGALLFSTNDAALIRRYFDAAVTSRQLDRGRSFLERLLSRFPNHRQTRTLYISLCLQLKEYHAAMSAIETLVAFSNPDEDLLDAALNVRAKIGPKTIDQHDGCGPRLSVCMIARNEQRYLPSCLNAVKKVAAEIVLVDTGSKDRTADVARIFGARVFDFQWQDDFAAARNAGLARAQGDWILILDADETIAEQDIAALVALLDDREAQRAAFSMETRNYTYKANTLKWHANSGDYAVYEAGVGWFPSRKIRLFPNHKKIRFDYPVHELVDSSVRSVGLAVKTCGIPIHHYGHLNETRNRKKAEAYFKMGYEKLGQLGEDVAAIRELAIQAGQLELWSESLALWQRLLKIRPDFYDAYVNMSGAFWQTGDYQAALGNAQKALDIDSGAKEAHYNVAVSHLLLGKAEAAARVLSALDREHDGYLAARFMLAATSACMGDMVVGVSIFRDLERSSVGKAIVYGIQDLTKRLEATGLSDYAANLAHAASLITSKTSS